MNRLDFYLLRNMITAFLFSAVGVSFVVLFTQAFRLISFIVENSGTALVFLQMIALMVPTFLPLVVPLSLGIAVLFIYHKFAVDSELVVMRAAGISPIRLAFPALFLALLGMVFTFMLTTWITPTANRELVALQYRVRDNFSIFLVKPGTFSDLSEGLTFFVRARGKNGELQDILIHDVRKPDDPITIMADTGQFTVENGEPQIEVFHGKRQEIDRSNGHLSELNFDSYVLDLKVLKNVSSDRIPDAREQNTWDLLNAGSVKTRGTPEHLIAEFHQRMATPLLAFTFVLIGITAILAGEFNRRGMARRIIIAALAIVAVEAEMLSLASLISKHLWLVPLLYAATLLPIILCFIILMSPKPSFRFGFSRPPPTATAASS